MSGAGGRVRLARWAGLALAATVLAAGAGCGEKEEPDLSTVEVTTETAPATTPTTPTAPATTPTTPAP